MCSDAANGVAVCAFDRSPQSEFIDATWPEVGFDKGLWTIPADRMKASKAHVVPLSEQAQDILVAFRSRLLLRANTSILADTTTMCRSVTPR